MVNLLYEHKLRRSASNFTIGQFGNTQNRDFIAVQSLDGMLSFYEQETFVFCCFLPDFLLPGCLVYAKRPDCFIITGSTLTIESYSYKNLSSCGQNSDENDAGGRKAHSDWSVNISEHMLDVQYLYDGFSKDSFIVVLGEKNLFCLNDMGKFKFMTRLDFTPVSMTAYLINEKVMTTLISETRTLLIFENTSLKWSANLADLPVAIARGDFRGLRGIFVTLEENGKLKCAYLGTEPILFQAPPLQSLQLNYEEADKELAHLTKIIKTSHNELKNANAQNDIKMISHLLSIDDNDESVTIAITIIPNSMFGEINVTVNVTRPLVADPHFMFLDSGFNKKLIFTSKIKKVDNITEYEDYLTTLDVLIIATCVSAIGIPKVITDNLALPMKLAFGTSIPQKDNRIKLVLNINESAPSLLDLFPEFCDHNTPNTLALKKKSNKVEKAETVTLLLAKSSSRYRLQSDTLACMNLPFNELMKRLRKYFYTNRNFQVSFDSSLPLKELNYDIKEHYEVTKQIERVQLLLIEFGAQFRIIQKRLISKFKDRHPTPLNNLNMLLDDTYNEILTVTEHLQTLIKKLYWHQMKLASGLEVIMTLLTLSNQNIDEVILGNLLNVPMFDVNGLNWEDVMDVNMSYLLRTLLAKSEKDKLRGCQEVYERVTDYKKFEKHFGIILDRLWKKSVKEENDYDLDERELRENEDFILPIGSKFGESSTRILSARHRKSSTTLRLNGNNNFQN